MKRTLKILLCAFIGVTAMTFSGCFWLIAGPANPYPEQSEPEHKHEYVEKITKAPDCLETGVKSFDCSCGDSYTEEIPTIVHDYQNGVCSMCKKSVSVGLSYTLSGDKKSYTVSGIGTCTDTEIIIPETYEKLPVTSIGEQAFKDCENLTSVDIPNSVTDINQFVFYGCKNLKSVKIPNSVTYIGRSSFYGCVYLTDVKIPNKVKYITESLFENCSGLTNVDIPNSVTEIRASAFSRCVNLKSINISNSVTAINKSAFSGSGLASINIPDSVTSIGVPAFYSCTHLESITVDTSNENYKSIDGNLYTKDGKTLIQYAIGKTEKSFTIPNGVTRIESYAVTWSNLKEMFIGGDVKSVGADAFSFNDSLVRVTFGDSVTSVEDRAFYGCGSLATVVIGSGLTKLDLGAFGATALAEITVNINNPVYCSLDGNLYSKDLKTLIRYAEHKEEATFEIPEGVERIESGAFHMSPNTHSVILPVSLKSIGIDAFDFASVSGVEFQVKVGWEAVNKDGETVFLDSEDLSDDYKAANYLKETYNAYEWKKVLFE